MCDSQFTLSFYIEEITFHETNIKVSEKMHYRKFLAYLLCPTYDLTYDYFKL